MWSSKPFVKILVFFIIGILIHSYFIPAKLFSPSILIITLVILLAISVLQYIGIKKRKYIWLKNMFIYLSIIVSALSISIMTDKNENEHEPNQNTGIFAGVITENPVASPRTIKVVVKIQSSPTDATTLNNPYKVLCYIQPSSSIENLKYGDVIAFSAKISTPLQPMNPYEFNYSNYLKQNGIYYTCYVKSDDYSVIGYKPENPVLAFALNLRNSLLISLKENGVDNNNYAVAAAVLLGFDDAMEQSTKDNYIQAGAMHILCVSGLHVGIIYLVFSFLLSFLGAGRTNSYIKAITLLFIIWFYATITGLSPSVQRASIMLSFFIIGNLLHRNRDTYNTLAASAFLLLAINPQLLFNVGFQLSYAAVFGIITLHRPIYNLIYFRNPLLDKIWSITVLSITAQLATFPIAVYYFHFFPTWFWLTNLFTFPLSFLIIATGLLFVVLSWIPVVSFIIGKFLAGLVYLLNMVVESVVYLPMPGIENIYFSFTMVCAIYCMLTLLYLIIFNKKVKLVIPTAVVLLLATALIINHNYHTLTQNRMVIYKVNNHSVFEFIQGNNQLIITDSLLSKNISELDFQIKNSRAIWEIENNTAYNQEKINTSMKNLFIDENFILFNNIRLYIYNKPLDFNPLNQKLDIDYIILSGNIQFNFDELTKLFSFEKVIIDNNVPPWQINKIEAALEGQHITTYNIKQKGAFVVNL